MKVARNVLFTMLKIGRNKNGKGKGKKWKKSENVNKN